MGIIHHLHHPLYVFLIDYYPRKTENRPCGIVRVDRHFNIVFITDRHDLFKEVFKIVKQVFLRNVFIFFEEFLNPGHSFRFPARHYRSVHIPGDGVEHLLRNKIVHRLFCVCKNGGTVRSFSRKFRPCPVKDGHEIVTYHMDVFFPEIT